MIQYIPAHNMKGIEELYKLLQVLGSPCKLDYKDGGISVFGGRDAKSYLGIGASKKSKST